MTALAGVVASAHLHPVARSDPDRRADGDLVVGHRTHSHGPK